MRLFRVELTRLRWRRAILLLLVAAVLAPVAIFGTVVYNTRPVSGDDLAAAEEQAAAEAEQPYVQREIDRCLRNPQRFGPVGNEDPRAFCESIILPRAEWFLYRETLDLGSERSDSGVAVVTLLCVLMLLVGTTFAGHDWNTGSMSNQVLFRPRRLQIWGAKALAVLVVGLLVSAAVLAAYWAALIGVAQMRDIALVDGQAGRILAQAGRGALLAAGAGLGGYVLTMLTRSTVVAVGALFAASIVGPLLLTLIDVPGSVALMPQNNAAAVILDGVEIRDYDSDACYDQRTGRETPNAPGCRTDISALDGGVYFGALLLLVGAPSAASFRRRDVP